MDLIILNDGLYQLIPVTKQMMDGIVLTNDVDCFDLCEILRLKWEHVDLNELTEAPDAARSPHGYAWDLNDTQHVAYLGTDQHIHER